MKFGEMPLSEAEGAILAHSIRHGRGTFKKGRVLSAADIALLAEAKVASIFAARLGDEDVPEDEAAGAIAKAIAGDGTAAHEPFTGRANLHAEAPGLVVIDAERVRALNRLHESLTLATSANHERVEARQMVATVKIIPFAVPRAVLIRALALAGNEPLIRVAAFRPRQAGLVITRLAQTKPSIIVKSETAMRDRIEALGGTLAEVIVCGHEIGEVADAVARLHRRHLNPILIFGSSAIVDRGDVIPQGLATAGGEIVHLGMPVDPGNLMMFGRIEGVPAIGVPSCARSPKLNGFDWVLERVMAGLHVSAQDIMDMGAGGLLKEIATRPLPREGQDLAQRAPTVAALVLAAGKSTRMGSNKLIADFAGRPMIRTTVEAVLASKARPIIVVSGHEPEKLTEALAGLEIQIVHNRDFTHGLSTSLRAGLAAVPARADGAVICLADMPLVGSRAIDKLISALNPAEGRSICVPVHKGERGNPVLWGRQHFAELKTLEGDQGARSLLEAHESDIAEVEMPDPSVLHDADTPEALDRLRSASIP